MEQPKGTLIAIGGAEDKGTMPEPDFIQKNNLNFFELGILKRFVDEIGKPNPHIEVVTTASSIPEEVGENYLAAFGKMGCTNVGTIHIKTRDDANQPEYTERIKKCDAVMLSGGNQLRLTSILGGTEFLETILHRYHHEDFVVVGTSAGAMAMSNTMIYHGNSTTAHLKGEVKITTGLAFIKGVIIDSHFEKRGRFNRLAQAVGLNPSCIGIGLGEDTGMLIKGTQMEAIGSGSVVIIDGHNIRHSNIADIPEGSPISLENIIVHVMVKEDRFDLSKRKFEANFISVME
ncbi:MAG: cyanophycinase [Flavobacteriaceae bacterium]|nr:cyanophycinase [Flavobacteriaceae bacterium]